MTTRTLTDPQPHQTDKALVEELNKIQTSLVQQGVLLHLENLGDDVVSVPAAADLPTVIVVANALKAAFNAHAPRENYHVVADETQVIAAANASDQSTANALLNEIKADFNLHAAVTYHRVADTAVSTANASDLATSIALANALVAAWNKHVQRGARPITFGF